MCGRFGRVHDADELELFARYYEALAYIKGYTPPGFKLTEYNVKPTTAQPFVRAVAGERRLELGTWGWRRDFSKSKAPLINARGEEAMTKRTWLPALRERRCVVPASFFYEWEPRTKQPYCYALRSREAFGIGGLWEETEGGPAFVLLTTVANEVCRPVHERMPLMLGREQAREWVDERTPFERVEGLIAPYPAEAMSGWAVSRLVSGIKNDGAELIRPVDVAEQQELF